MIFFWQVDIIIWQVNINNWQVNIKIRQVDIIIWQVMAEIYHHIFSCQIVTIQLNPAIKHNDINSRITWRNTWCHVSKNVTAKRFPMTWPIHVHVEWLIVRGFTPYRQYFSPVTADYWTLWAKYLFTCKIVDSDWLRDIW